MAEDFSRELTQINADQENNETADLTGSCETETTVQLTGFSDSRNPRKSAAKS